MIAASCCRTLPLCTGFAARTAAEELTHIADHFLLHRVCGHAEFANLQKGRPCCRSFPSAQGLRPQTFHRNWSAASCCRSVALCTGGCGAIPGFSALRRAKVAEHFPLHRVCGKIERTAPMPIDVLQNISLCTGFVTPPPRTSTIIALVAELFPSAQGLQKRPWWLRDFSLPHKDRA
jgi:hypothetical protein